MNRLFIQDKREKYNALCYKDGENGDLTFFLITSFKILTSSNFFMNLFQNATITLDSKMDKPVPMLATATQELDVNAMTDFHLKIAILDVSFTFFI